MIVRLLFLLSLAWFAACVNKPTVVREVPERKMEAPEKLLAPIQITPETVVVDARPRFDYALAHIPHSVSIEWQDYTQPEPESRGVLQTDLFALTRRLARLGIAPTTPVVVIGRGEKGEGEEGRVAWMLAFLGVTNVQFAGIDAFKAHMTNEVDGAAAKNVPIWKPMPIESLNVTRDELLTVFNKRGVNAPIAYPAGTTPRLYRIIDVRSSKAYLGREGLGAHTKIPDLDAINIPWTEFFDSQLRPRSAMVARLAEVGIRPEQRLIIVDENGVASAAVTMALRGLGFSHAGNDSGGLRELMGALPTRQ